MPSLALDKFEKAVAKVLQDYADDVHAEVGELARSLAKKGAQAVKQASSQFGGSGRYAKGWTSQYEETRLSSQGVIYNKSVPGLPHLLEKGHALRNGGRAPGRVHIAPIEERLVEEFEKAVKAKL